jgi:hypothetical protein
MKEMKKTTVAYFKPLSQHCLESKININLENTSVGPDDPAIPFKCISKYCDVHAVGNIACVDNRCYGNG